VPRTVRRLLLAGVAVVLLFPPVFSLLVLRRPVWDEALYHLPALARFGPGLPGLDLLRSYESAVGPLFYVLFANLTRLFGSHLTFLRLLVFLGAVVAALLFHRLFAAARRETGSPDAAVLPALLLLVSYPYFFTLSGLFMSEPPALALSLAALLGYLNWRRTPSLALLALTLCSATAAIYIRQFSLFLPATFVAGELAAPSGRRWRWLLMLLPAVAFLPLAMLWRGLVPPGLQFRHYPGLALGNVGSILCWTGFVCLPWVVTACLRLRRFSLWLLLALVAVPVVLLSPLPGPGVVRALLAALPGLLGRALAVLLALAGALALVLICFRLTAAAATVRTAALAAVFLLLILALGGPTLYERHFLPAIPLLLLAFAESIRLVPALVWSLAIQLPLAVVQVFRLSGR